MKKENLLIVGFAILEDHRVKTKKQMKRETSTQTLLETKITMEHEGDDDTNCDCCAWNDS